MARLTVSLSVVALLLTLLLPSQTCFGQIAAESSDMTPQQREQRLISFSQRELTLELIRIDTMFEVSDDVRLELHAVGKPVAESIGKNRAKDKKLPTFILRNFPGEPLSSVLSKELKQRLGDEAAKRYENDVRARIDFFDQAYSGILLVMLDQQVGLTSEQVPAAIAEIKKLPRFRYTHPHIHSYDWAWGITPPPEFVQHKGFGITRAQRELWNVRGELLSPLWSTPEIESAPKEKLVETTVRLVRDRCRVAIEHKVGIAAEQFDLDEKQVKRVRLLTKRLVRDLPESIRKAWDFTQLVRDGEPTRLRVRCANFDLTYQTDLFDLIESQSQWRVILSSVMTPEQQAILKKRHSERVAHNHNANWRCWVVCYSLRLGLTAKQEQALFDLVSRSIKPDPTATRMSHTGSYQLGTIPRDAYVKAIGEKHTADLDDRLLNALRDVLVEDKKMGE